MLECSNTAHKCSLCSYTTDRKYNYERHVNATHNILLSTLKDDVSKLDTNLSKLDILPQLQNIQNNHYHKCKTCYKTFFTKYTLKRHIPKCNHKEHPTQCVDCSNIFSSHSALTHHKKYCKGSPLIISNNNSSVNILPFPLTRDKSFNLNCDNISYKILKHILQNTNDSSIRFNRFIEKIFENSQNLMIRKSSPEDNYSSIHLGNNNWELAYDKDILPILIYHIASAALRKILEIEKWKPLLMDVIKEFQNEVTEIIEMDYNKDEYKDILERIKIKIVNITPELVKEKE